MARVVNNTFTSGISGKVGGDMVFKTWKNGRTFLYQKPEKPKKQSPKQKANRTKFQMATFFAKTVTSDPVKKAEYWEKARKLNLPNAYTAAITEYMRTPEIQEVDLSDYNGEEGDEIRVTARKKDFEVEAVEVIILDEAGKEVESGTAERKWGNWVYRVSGSYAVGVKFVVTVRDRVGNERQLVNERMRE